jgi:hypothetical protein
VSLIPAFKKKMCKGSIIFNKSEEEDIIKNVKIFILDYDNKKLYRTDWKEVSPAGHF